MLLKMVLGFHLILRKQINLINFTVRPNGEGAEEMKCPICDKEIMKENYTHYSSEQTEEEHARCEDGKHFYSYAYEYGNYEESLGNVTFGYSYMESKEAREVRNKQYNAVLAIERENYQKLQGGESSEST